MKHKIKYSEQLPNVFPREDGGNAPEYLKWIKGFNPKKHDVSDFISVIVNNWGHGCGEINLREDYSIIKLITCGLKENEEIIEALKRNKFFFDMFWESSERSGTHVFKIQNRFIEKQP